MKMPKFGKKKDTKTTKTEAVVEAPKVEEIVEEVSEPKLLNEFMPPLEESVEVRTKVVKKPTNEETMRWHRG